LFWQVKRDVMLMKQIQKENKMFHRFFRKHTNLFHFLGIILALTACTTKPMPSEAKMRAKPGKD
jgi:hypothetical protein